MSLAQFAKVLCIMLGVSTGAEWWEGTHSNRHRFTFYGYRVDADMVVVDVLVWPVAEFAQGFTLFAPQQEAEVVAATERAG